MDLSSFIWGVLVGVVGSSLVWVGSVVLLQPKLVLTGGSSSSATAMISNGPGLFKKVDERTFLRIHLPFFQVGWPVDRRPARGCDAFLRKQPDGKPSRLWWREPGQGNPVQNVTFGPGETRELCLFATETGTDPVEYKPWEPDGHEFPNTPSYVGEGSYKVWVRNQYSKVMVEFELRVFRDPNGWQLMIGDGGGTFG